MTVDYISDLNTQIAELTPENIQSHLDKGDLADWLGDWRMRAAATSFGLFVLIVKLTKEVGQQ